MPMEQTDRQTDARYYTFRYDEASIKISAAFTYLQFQIQVCYCFLADHVFVSPRHLHA